jgi:hypothetical protein
LHVVQFLLIIGTSYCLFKTATTNPGRLDNSYPNIDTWRRLYEETLESLANDTELQHQGEKKTPNGKTLNHRQLCHTCHIARPARSKHDRFTRACILQFDHHCPFVGNTVGLHNYKWFYAFLLGMTTFFVFFWILLFFYWRRFTPTPVLTIAIGVFLGLHIFFPAGMLIYHSQLIFVNLTTNEHINVAKYEYLWQTTNEDGSQNKNDQQPGASATASQQRRFYNPWDKGCLGNLMDRFAPNDMCYLIPEEQSSLLLNTDNINNNQNNSSHRNRNRPMSV